MPVELLWLERTEQDLQSVFDYISAENPKAAKAYIESIVSACDRLRTFLCRVAFTERHTA